MALGSGLFSKAMAKFAHLIKPGGGLSGEIADVRADILDTMTPLAAIAVYDVLPTGQPAGATGSLHAATATTVAVQTLLTAALVASGVTALAAWPRPITFTTAGGTAADAPANVVITGTDQNGAAQSETLALGQTAVTVTSVKSYKTITSLVYAAGDGTGATIAVGFGAALIFPATATVTTPVTLTASQLNQGDLVSKPRQIVFTTAGGTAADAPANAVITGTDARGLPLSETVVLAQTATTAKSNNYFGSITSIAYPAGDGTGATISISINNATIGLPRLVRMRTGAALIIKEFMDGSAPTPGALSLPGTTELPYGSYTPNAAPDSIHIYTIYYEYDPRV